MKKLVLPKNMRLAFSKIFILVILIILVAGGILAWQYFWSPEEKIQLGIIEGSLGYPSDYIPPNMKVCAENIATEELYCTEVHMKDSKYIYGEGYKIEVPAGDYYIYATLPNGENYKAYYSELVVCGLKAGCLSHQPISVKVGEGKLVSGIDPIDWYKPPEEVQDETANWKTYGNDEYGFEIKYPEDFGANVWNPHFWPPKITVVPINEAPLERGCLDFPAGIQGATESKLSINNIFYPLFMGNEGAAGFSYTGYCHVTEREQKYYVINFVIRTTNGCGGNCGPYCGTQYESECINFNFEKDVKKPVEKIISTFKFLSK